MKARLMAWAVLVGGMAALVAQEKEGVSSSVLMERLLSAQALWEMEAGQFITDYKALGFEWMSGTKDSARADGKRIALSAFGKRVGETIVQFEAGVPKQLQVSFYNRGDNGDILEDQYEALLQFWGRKLNEISGVSGERRGKDNKNAVRAEGVIWTTDSTAYLLEYSAEKRPFRGEFVRLRVAKLVKKGFMEERLAKEGQTVRADLLGNVVRKEGDVMIQGIPMVDQGEKGYCVVASAARIFAYYGKEVDQHEIAQMANSSATGGTDPRVMMEQLDRVAGRFKMRVKRSYEQDILEVKDVTEDYNRIAKRAGKKELPDDPYQFNLWDNYDQFDAEVLKEARLKDKSGFKRFKGEIENSIDMGVPLLWSMQLGIYREEKLNPQAKGGHTRMIIGYNWTKNELIITDSWGAGHEAKRVGAEEAFCATQTGLYSILPIK